MTVPIEGFVAPGFTRLRDAFARNFDERGELGGAVAVYSGGRPVVDLWGGRTVHQQQPSTAWQRDTIVRMMSVNKTMTAISAHRLVDRGLLDYDSPVARYWPEFAAAGKGEITLGTLMAAMAGMAYPDGVPDGKAFEWEAMVEGLARQPPCWTPNTLGAYHATTYGHLVGEVIRRVTGVSPGTCFRREIGEPLGVDYWFAVPPPEQGRISEVLPPKGGAARAPVRPNRSMRIWPSQESSSRDDPYTFDREMPSANGRGNARAVGKVFAALAVGGTLDGVRLLSSAAIERMSTLSWDNLCPVTGQRWRYAMGSFLSTPGLLGFGSGERSFGHHGAGGSVGFADPERGLAFAYCTSQMCDGPGLGERCQSLIDALYAVAG